MNKIKLLTIILLIVLAVTFSLSVYAEGETPTPKIYAQSPTIKAGNEVSMTVYASDLSSIGALEVFLFYDSSIFEITGVYDGSLVSGQSTSTNYSTPGEISFNMISPSGVSGSGALFTVNLVPKLNTAAGSYNVTLAAGNVYDTDLSAVKLDVESPKITVISNVEAQKTVSIYDTGSSETVHKGDSVTLTFNASNAYSLASAIFEIEYDAEVLQFESLTLGDKLLNAENAIYSINDNVPGYVIVSYAATEGVTGFVPQIVSITFTVIAEGEVSTEVHLKPSAIYSDTLEAMKGSNAKHTVRVADKTDSEKLPLMSVSGYEGTDDVFDVYITAPGYTNLAAVDFEISFDPTKIACVGTAKVSENSFIIANVDNKNGKIKFSFICEDGITEDTRLIKLTFSRAGLAGGKVRLDVVGKSAVDSNFSSIEFEYESADILCHVIGPAPTCTSAQACTMCGKEFLPALGHDEVAHEGRAPTCAQSGCEPYVTCKRCDYSTYKEINVLPHDVVTYEYKLPTCTEPGNDIYEVCKNCSYTTYKEIPPLGHRVMRLTNVWVDPIVFTNDWLYPFELQNGEYVSTNKGDYTESTFTIRAIYECALTIKCSVSSEIGCDEMVIRINGGIQTSLSGEVYDQVITLNLKIGDVVTITYSKDASVSGGLDEARFSCSFDQVLTSKAEQIPADEVEATCYSGVTCSYCSVQVKPARGHDYGEWSIINMPTCSYKGMKSHRCNTCGYNETAMIDTIDHTPGAAETQSFTNATCTTDGHYDSVISCSMCRTEISRERIIIPAKGHRSGVPVVQNAVNPTCTEDGRHDEVTHCAVCSIELARETKIDAKLGHNYSIEWTVDVQPTCTTEGSMSRHCTRCTDRIEVTPIAATGHSFGEWYQSKAPNCIESGINERVCIGCGIKETSPLDPIGDNGHVMGDWIIDKEATNEAEGSKHKECTVCKKVLETSIIPILSHSYVTVLTPPTCTDRGYKTHTCTNCGHSYVDDFTDPIGHKFGAWTAVKAPTCTENGAKARKCARCDTEETEEVNAHGHKNGIPVVENKVDSTCTAKGSYDEVVYCTYCKGELSRQKKEIEPQGHLYSVNWTVDIQPTCATDGSKSRHCTRCDDKTDVTVLYAEGHSFGAWYGVSAPDCATFGVEERVCSICRHKETRSTEALGHSYSTEWSVDLQPTCTTAGSKSHHCMKCGDKMDVTEIAPLGHSFGEWYTAKAATCTEKGIDERKCSNCGYTEAKETEATGHKAGTPVEENKKNPTCTESGSCDEVVYCSECSVEISRRNKALAPLGHDEVQHAAKAPTCTEKGWDAYVTCKNCDRTTYVERAATGHDFGEWTEKEAASCKSKGSEERKCKNCGQTETRELSAASHLIAYAMLGLAVFVRKRRFF